ncbi:MAG: nuclear transport factor 2 family protein [Acidobacteriota bacterium]
MPADTKTIDELLRISDAILQAICSQDAETLSLYLTDDFVLLSGDVRQGREAFLEGVGAAQFTALEAAFESIQVEPLGTTAVVAGVQRVDVEQGSEVLMSRASFTDVFVRD